MNRTTAGRGRERGAKGETGAGGAGRGRAGTVVGCGRTGRRGTGFVSAQRGSCASPGGSVPKGRRPVLPGESKRPQVPTTCFPDLCGWGADGVQTGRRSD